MNLFERMRTPTARTVWTAAAFGLAAVVVQEWGGGLDPWRAACFAVAAVLMLDIHRRAEAFGIDGEDRLSKVAGIVWLAMPFSTFVALCADDPSDPSNLLLWPVAGVAYGALLILLRREAIRVEAIDRPNRRALWLAILGPAAAWALAVATPLWSSSPTEPFFLLIFFAQIFAPRGAEDRRILPLLGLVPLLAAHLL